MYLKQWFTVDMYNKLGHIAVTPTYQIIRFNNVTDLGYHVHS